MPRVPVLNREGKWSRTCIPHHLQHKLHFVTGVPFCNNKSRQPHIVKRFVACTFQGLEPAYRNGSRVFLNSSSVHGFERSVRVAHGSAGLLITQSAKARRDLARCVLTYPRHVHEALAGRPTPLLGVKAVWIV